MSASVCSASVGERAGVGQRGLYGHGVHMSVRYYVSAAFLGVCAQPDFLRRPLVAFFVARSRIVRRMFLGLPALISFLLCVVLHMVVRSSS